MTDQANTPDEADVADVAETVDIVDEVEGISDDAARRQRVEETIDQMTTLEDRLVAVFSDLADDDGAVVVSPAHAAKLVTAELGRILDEGLGDFFDEYWPIERALESYRGVPIPPCRLCGGPLTIGSAGGGNATAYACANAGIGKHKKYGMDHYSDSRYVHVRSGDTLAYMLLSFAAAVMMPTRSSDDQDTEAAQA